MKDIITGKAQHGCVVMRLDAGLGGHVDLRHGMTCYRWVLIIICMMSMLSACMNADTNNGNNPLLKGKESEVFQDPAVVQLAEAAAKGDRQAIHDLVQQGVDVNTRGTSDFSILDWAFFNKSIDGMLALLEAGANPALTDRYGHTVMHLAAGIEDPILLQALLDAGVSPDLRDSKGRTPIFDAIWHDREPQFRALIAAGADLNAQDLIINKLGEPTGDRPLHHAAILNDVKRVLVLLEAGADPRAVDGYGSTFQYFLNVLDESIATDEFIQNKRKIEQWLLEHGIALERERPGTTDSETKVDQSQN